MYDPSKITTLPTSPGAGSPERHPLLVKPMNYHTQGQDCSLLSFLINRFVQYDITNITNISRKGLLGRTDQTHRYNSEPKA